MANIFNDGIGQANKIKYITGIIDQTRHLGKNMGKSNFTIINDDSSKNIIFSNDNITCNLNIKSYKKSDAVSFNNLDIKSSTLADIVTNLNISGNKSNDKELNIKIKKLRTENQEMRNVHIKVHSGKDKTVAINTKEDKGLLAFLQVGNEDKIHISIVGNDPLKYIRSLGYTENIKSSYGDVTFDLSKSPISPASYEGVGNIYLKNGIINFADEQTSKNIHLLK